MRVGFLHPGAMGAALAATCAVDDRVWVSSGRSSATAARAAEVGLVDADSLAELVDGCEVIVSICPPDAAVDVAHRVGELRFEGVYVDANAVAPATARRMAADLAERSPDAGFVDGSVIGPPPLESGTTRLYVSGARADQVSQLWAGSKLDAVALDGGVGAASALKMAFAGWTKVSAALLLNTVAYAEANGVGDELVAEWAQILPGLGDRAERSASGVGPKAWRFVGEMDQIAAAHSDAGLPPGFAQSAAEIYERLAGLKHAPPPDLKTVTDSILGS